MLSDFDLGNCSVILSIQGSGEGRWTLAALPDQRALVLAQLVKGKVDREETMLLLGDR